MRTTNLAVVISSVLLGAFAAQAQPTSSASGQVAQSTTQTDTSRPATTSSAPDADTATGTSSTEQVGSDKSNADKKSASGAYYPYSAGTSGDDPSQPKSTSVSEQTREDTTQNTSEKDFGSTAEWTKADADGDGYVSKSELAKVEPKLASAFSAMDVNRDEKLSRDEAKAWDETHKGSMEADTKPANGESSSSAEKSSAEKSPDESSHE